MASIIINIKLIKYEKQSVNSLLRNCESDSFSPDRQILLEDICKCSTELESLIYTLGPGKWLSGMDLKKAMHCLMQVEKIVEKAQALVMRV